MEGREGQVSELVAPRGGETTYERLNLRMETIRRASQRSGNVYTAICWGRRVADADADARASAGAETDTDAGTERRNG